MLPSTLVASVSGMESPSLAGCNGSATLAIHTSACMEIRSSWTQLALPARLSAGGGSVGAGGGGHGPPWCACLHASASLMLRLSTYTTGSSGLQAGVIGSGAAGGAVDGGWWTGQPWAASLSTPLLGGA